MAQHKHQCPDCEFVWKHDRTAISDGDAFDRAHSCPNCGGEGVTKKYHGDLPAACVNDGGPNAPEAPAATLRRLEHEALRTQQEARVAKGLLKLSKLSKLSKAA